VQQLPVTLAPPADGEALVCPRQRLREAAEAEQGVEGVVVDRRGLTIARSVGA